VNVSGTVIVVDETGAAVKSASVKGEWTLPDGSKVLRTASSNKRGRASFSTDGERGTYTLTVLDIIKTGYSFDSANSVLEKSIEK